MIRLVIFLKQTQLQKLLSEYNNHNNKTLEDILEFHVQFERIHPFQDVNRLRYRNMNQLRLWKVWCRMMKTLNEYMAMSYRMEIVENKRLVSIAPVFGTYKNKRKCK